MSEKTNENDSLKKVAVYIHIPFCLSRCAYCDFFSTVTKEAVPQKYVYALINDLNFRLTEYFHQNKNACVSSVYIGGGTPSLLSEKQLKQLCASIRNFKASAFSSSDFKASSCKTSAFTANLQNFPVEFTIECNPGDLNLSMLDVFSQCGINRISLGIQSLNPKTLELVGRRADVRQNIEAMSLLKNSWNGQYSFDLISGMPFETNESFLDGLKTAVSFTPHHISLYALTVEEETPLGKSIASGKLKYDYSYADSMWILGNELLRASGYTHYEVSNYARSGFECRHNISYWNHQDYIGVGSNGTGTVYLADGTAVRKTGSMNLHEYIDFWCNSKSNIENNLENPSIKNAEIPQYVEILDRKTSQFEFFMMGMRKFDGISENQYKKAFSENLPENFLKLFEQWQAKNFAYRKTVNEDNFYALNEAGMLLLNEFLENLL